MFELMLKKPGRPPLPQAGLLWIRQLKSARATLRIPALLALLCAPVAGHSEIPRTESAAARVTTRTTPLVASTAEAPTAATQHSFLQRAKKHRQAGDLRREQFELTKALRAWPNSTALRHAYALHLVRRKNLTGALTHTTHSLSINRNQPATANLHLQLLARLDRSADSVAWVIEHLTLNRAQAPFELWSSGWLSRWQQVLKLGRKHAGVTNNNRALALINHALNSPSPKSALTNTPANGS